MNVFKKKEKRKTTSLKVNSKRYNVVNSPDSKQSEPSPVATRRIVDPFADVSDTVYSSITKQKVIPNSPSAANSNTASSILPNNLNSTALTGSTATSNSRSNEYNNSQLRATLPISNTTSNKDTMSTVLTPTTNNNFRIDKKGKTRIVIQGGTAKGIKVKKFQIQNAYDSNAAGDLVCRITPPHPPIPFITSSSFTSAAASSTSLVNECLFSLRITKFDFPREQQQLPHNGTTNNNYEMTLLNDLPTFGQIRKGMKSKFKNKLRYVCILWSTTHPLIKKVKDSVFIRKKKKGLLDDSSSEDEDDASAYDDEDDDDNHLYDDDVDSDAGYDDMFNPDMDNPNDYYNYDSEKRTNHKKFNATTTTSAFGKDNNNNTTTPNNTDNNNSMIPHQDVISSFPFLVCFTLTSDGSHPEIRKVIALDKLVAVENVTGNANNNNNNGMIKLVFSTGDVIELFCDQPAVMDESSSLTDNEVDIMLLNNNNDTNTSTAIMGSNSKNNTHKDGNVYKEKFLWSLLQIHAILCTSVVERNRTRSQLSPTVPTALPPLTMKNVDRAELQYVSTAHGFLADNKSLMALLERQRGSFLNVASSALSSSNKKDESRTAGSISVEEKVDNIHEMDDMAYDMIMGNFTRLTLFLNDEEKQDAEDVLNSTSWLQVDKSSNEKINMDEISTAETLSKLLQKRMRELEAETCRRLIAWEDEKYYSMTGNAPKRRDTMEALSLSTLFQTLDTLDRELEAMEEWLADKSAAVKPLTDGCFEIQEENRQLEQQFKSFELLSSDLQRLLSGMEIPPELDSILRDPFSKVYYDSPGNINLTMSENSVESMYEAGRYLRDSFDDVQDEGGVHLRGVYERVEGLSKLANSYTMAVSRIVQDVMTKASLETTGDDAEFQQEFKSSTHAVVTKSLRETQRKFQSHLLSYLKLIEVIALLKPSLLSSLRDSYSDIVGNGILRKKRMKTYFLSLPGKSISQLSHVTQDLDEYHPTFLRSSSNNDIAIAKLKPVEAQDIQLALKDLLPVISREAFFTAALFSSTSKHLSGREKRRNFETTRKSVDHSTQYFKYYISRICGIESQDAEGKKVHADPMLSLVASIYLNEAIQDYIDKEKKGGDHSLSLAYVRATILDLRKKVDKQWVSWVEKQIKWINTHPGVPLDGKRAGVMISFQRFPSYLDHIVLCLKSGRPDDKIPNISKVKVVTYYLQKLARSLFFSLKQCAERESTDQEYAANVMRMENSYYFTQTIKQRGPVISELFRKEVEQASEICKKSTDAYLGYMIKKEFKALYQLFFNIHRIRRDVGNGDVAIHVSRSRFESTIEKECNRDILKEKVSIIFYRMEKHLSEAAGLLPVAWKAVVKLLYEWFGRWEKLSKQCYNVKLNPSAADVVRIAKQAAGSSVSKKKKLDEKKYTESVALRITHDSKRDGDSEF